MERFISTRTHAIIGYIVGALLLFAPNIFGFADNGGAAVAMPRIIGVIMLMSELITDSGLGLVSIIPMKVHLILDMGASFFLAVSPWLFGFHNQGANAWAPHLIAGLAYLVVAMATQTEPSTRTSRHAHA
jgi:hypothetical protein